MNELQAIINGRSYTFQPGQTVLIGRLPDSGIVVEDPTVSRRHAQLTWGPVGWVFENLGQARAFQHGQDVTRIIIRQPVELALASPQGPVVRLQPLGMAGPTSPADPRETWAAAQTAGAPFGGATPGGSPYGGVGPGSSPYGGASPGGGLGSHGGAAPRAGHSGTTVDELAIAFEILVPVKSWLKDTGWRQSLRLLVIAYALLPLVFLAVFSSSGSLSTPGFAYSLYIAPLWAIAFWLLLRPGKIAATEIKIAVAIIVWVAIWINVVTVNINHQLISGLRNGNLIAALIVGYNEEITKALPVLLAALILLKYRSTKLGVRMWMFLGTISGLTFGVLEERFYTEMAIAQVANANAVSQADAGVLNFAFRVFVDGFEHAVWAGTAAFFIGIAVNFPRRRWQLILFGVSMVAVLHGLNDWSLSIFNSLWIGILIQAVSLLLFLGYTMSATSIEREVRRTPLFRGDSMLMEVVSEPKEAGGS